MAQKKRQDSKRAGVAMSVGDQRMLFQQLDAYLYELDQKAGDLAKRLNENSIHELQKHADGQRRGSECALTL